MNYCGQGILWNARTGKLLERFDTGVQTVSAISLDTHGRLLALSSWSRTTTIFDLDSKRALRVLVGDTASVTDVGTSGGFSVAFSSNGVDVVFTGSNGQIHAEDACSLCGNAGGLMRLAARRVTRQLTAAERREYGA